MVSNSIVKNRWATFSLISIAPSAQRVIEIDGGQHDTEEGQAQDSKRDASLHDIGLSVLRFSNLDVLGNMDGVIAEIVRDLETECDKTKSP